MGHTSIGLADGVFHYIFESQGKDARAQRRKDRINLLIGYHVVCAPVLYIHGQIGNYKSRSLCR